MTLDKTFYGLLFKQEVVAVPDTSTFSSLSHSSRPVLEMYLYCALIVYLQCEIIIIIIIMQ